MIREIREFVKRRTEELEEESGLTRSIGPVERRRLQALDRALECNHPTADIDEMLTDIERGRDLR